MTSLCRVRALFVLMIMVLPSLCAAAGSGKRVIVVPSRSSADAGDYPAADAGYVTPAAVITKRLSVGAGGVGDGDGDRSSASPAVDEQMMVLQACGGQLRIVERQVLRHRRVLAKWDSLSLA